MLALITDFKDADTFTVGELFADNFSVPLMNKNRYLTSVFYGTPWIKKPYYMFAIAESYDSKSAVHKQQYERKSQNESHT